MGFLKLVGVLCVFLLAGLACLFVLDIVPRETLQEMSTKIVLVTAIIGAAGFAAGAVMKKPGA